MGKEMVPLGCVTNSGHFENACPHMPGGRQRAGGPRELACLNQDPGHAPWPRWIPTVYTRLAVTAGGHGPPQRMPDACLLWGSEVALILMCRKSEGLIKEWGTAVLRSKGPGW